MSLTRFGSIPDNPPNLTPTPTPPQADWLRLGFMLSIYYLAVWAGSALTVWRALGIW